MRSILEDVGIWSWYKIIQKNANFKAVFKDMPDLLFEHGDMK